jgi:hypothetical protein
VWYPRPFVFSVQPLEGHPDFGRRHALSRALCLYDNAGEHFLPGGETANSPSRHLALAEVLFFLFDPTQHPKFRKQCKGKTADPQMGNHGWSHQQHQVLSEAASRIRRDSGWAQNDKYKNPLVVILTKFDAWRILTAELMLDLSHAVRKVGPNLSALDVASLREVSDLLRRLLLQYAPEFVTAAETFAERVTYLPVSALGRGPELFDAKGYLGIRPRNIQPLWAEVPLLFALNHGVQGLVRAAVRKVESGAGMQGESPAALPVGLHGSATSPTAGGEDEAPRLRETGT